MKSHLFPKGLIVLTVLFLLLSACGPKASIAKSNLPRITSPNASTDDIHVLTDENNAFALDLYQSLHSRNGNLIYSPYSISLALAMTYAGARGETESQMAQTLHFLPQDQLHPAFNALDLALKKEPINLNKDQEPMKLNIANAV